MAKGEGRTARVSLVMRPSELERVRRQAKRAGQKLSTFCRDRILDERSEVSRTVS